MYYTINLEKNQCVLLVERYFVEKFLQIVAIFRKPLLTFTVITAIMDAGNKIADCYNFS